MRRNPVGTVNHIQPRTEVISTASLQIASGSADLSASRESQAGGGDSAISMEELTSEVKYDAEKRQSTVTENQDWEGFVRSRSIGLGMGAYSSSGASADISVRRFSAKENAAYSTVLWQGLIGSVDAENDAEWSSRSELHTCCRHTQVFSFCRRVAGDGGAANADSYVLGFTSTVLGALSSRAVRWA
jgi:hypothetical protein